MNRGQRRAAWIAQHREVTSERSEWPSQGARQTAESSSDPRKTSDVLRSPSVLLHVQELWLHGFATRDRYALSDSLQNELTRLIAEHGVPPALTRGGETKHIDAGSFALAHGEQANDVGTQTARAVYGGPQR